MTVYQVRHFKGYLAITSIGTNTLLTIDTTDFGFGTQWVAALDIMVVWGDGGLSSSGLFNWKSAAWRQGGVINFSNGSVQEIGNGGSFSTQEITAAGDNVIVQANAAFNTTEHLHTFVVAKIQDGL